MSAPLVVLIALGAWVLAVTVLATVAGAVLGACSRTRAALDAQVRA